MNDSIEGEYREVPKGEKIDPNKVIHVGLPQEPMLSQPKKGLFQKLIRRLGGKSNPQTETASTPTQNENLRPSGLNPDTQRATDKTSKKIAETEEVIETTEQHINDIINRKRQGRVKR